ncbi:MAG: LPXTG cell wall anchor domain-containing protein [Oscillospiraceae bacterium]|nr:LPXTG cell wall anchor domain-containing protein [Oscillospiraceae bacterium]
MKHATYKLLSLLLALVLAAGAAVPAFAEETGLSDGTYKPASLTSSLGMFKFADDYTVEVKGNDAWLVVTSTVDRYDRIILSPYSETLNDTSGVAGEPVKNGDTVTGYAFRAPIAKSALETALAGDGKLDYALRYRADYTDKNGNPSDNAGKWYAGSKGGYYFTLGALTKAEETADETADYTAVDAAIAALPADLTAYTTESAQAVTDAVNAVTRDLPKEQQAQVDAMAQAIANAAAALVPAGGESSGSKVELAVTNTTSMFKAVSARLVTKDNVTSLVVALNGSTYQNLIPGTYDEAVALGDKRDTWVKSYTNASGKNEFILPLEEGQTNVPVVSVSNTYLKGYEAGSNSLSRAFYPRQFVIDYSAKTLTVGDYENTQALTVINNVSMFKVSAAALHTVGGPNSNNYKAELILTMGSTAYDKLFAGYGADIDDKAETQPLGDGNTFVLPVRWVVTAGDPDSVVDLLQAVIVASFHSAKKDTWNDRALTVSESEGTLVIDPAGAYTDATAASEWKPDGDTPLAVTVKRDNDDEDTFAHFAGVLMDGKTVDPANYEAKSGSVIVTFKDAYLKTLSAGKHVVTILFDDGRLDHTVTLAAAPQSPADSSTPASGTAASPNTGDAGTAVWSVLALTSLAGIALLLRKRQTTR